MKTNTTKRHIVTYIARLYGERAKRATPPYFMGCFSKASICTSPLVTTYKEANKAGEKSEQALWEVLKPFFSFKLFLQN